MRIIMRKQRKTKENLQDDKRKQIKKLKRTN